MKKHIIQCLFAKFKARGVGFEAISYSWGFIHLSLLTKYVQLTLGLLSLIVTDDSMQI